MGAGDRRHRAAALLLIVVALVAGFVPGSGHAAVLDGQAVETPAETPVELPAEVPPVALATEPPPLEPLPTEPPPLEPLPTEPPPLEPLPTEPPPLEPLPTEPPPTEPPPTEPPIGPLPSEPPVEPPPTEPPDPVEALVTACTLDGAPEDCENDVRAVGGCPGEETAAQACESALYRLAGNALCGVGQDCVPAGVQGLRGCVQWEQGSPSVAPPCLETALLDALCEGLPCLFDTPVGRALLGVREACESAPGAATCEQSLRDLVSVGLCPDPIACFPALAEDLESCALGAVQCHALALLRESCRRAPAPVGAGAGPSPCGPQLAALEPCVVEPGRCANAEFVRGWVMDACAAGPSAEIACPERLRVRQVATGAGEDRVVVPTRGNGSAALPYATIDEALVALRGQDPLAPRARGPVDVDAGVYGPISAAAGDAYLVPVVALHPAAGVVLDGGGGPALVLRGEHKVRLAGPVTLVGGIDGPQARTAVVAPWAVLPPGHPMTLTISSANVEARTAEPLRHEVVVEGTLARQAGALDVGGAWDDGGFGPSAGALRGRLRPTSGPVGTDWGALEMLTVAARVPGSFQVRVSLVGVHTGWQYASASSPVITVEEPRASAPSPAPAPPAPDLPDPVRLSGADRAATAASVSRAAFPEGADQAYVATGASYADALAAGPAATRAGGPVVLVERDAIPPATRAELERLGPSRVHVLGGTSAVGERVEAELRATGAEVVRHSGDSRYATAAAVSAAHWPPGVPVAYVAGGDGFADALSGGAAAAVLGGPVLLTRRDEVPQVTDEELRRLRPAQIVVLGGQAAVSPAVEEALRRHGGRVRRVSGPTRYATSAAVSRDAFPGRVAAVYVATGETFPDALAGVPAAGRDGAPLLLVEPNRLHEEVAAELDRMRPRRIVILGGERSVSQRLARELRSYQVP